MVPEWLGFLCLCLEMFRAVALLKGPGPFVVVGWHDCERSPSWFGKMMGPNRGLVGYA